MRCKETPPRSEEGINALSRHTRKYEALYTGISHMATFSQVGRGSKSLNGTTPIWWHSILSSVRVSDISSEFGSRDRARSGCATWTLPAGCSRSTASRAAAISLGRVRFRPAAFRKRSAPDKGRAILFSLTDNGGVYATWACPLAGRHPWVGGRPRRCFHLGCARDADLGTRHRVESVLRNRFSTARARLPHPTSSFAVAA